MRHIVAFFLFKIITTQKLKFNKTSNLKLSLYFKFRVKIILVETFLVRNMKVYFIKWTFLFFIKTRRFT